MMLAKIAVFDSGLGSLSIIDAIQRETRCDVVYFADQRNFPYGEKSEAELQKIVRETIRMLDERFEPDFVVVGSNTPTILLNIGSERILGVKPPIKEAQKISKTKNIAILATRSMIQSRSLARYIERSKDPEATIHKINSSDLVELVESGDFLNDKEKTQKTILETLHEGLECNHVDVATLSSTHLPFLREHLEKQFPRVRFLDPAESIAKEISGKIRPLARNSLEIYSTDRTKTFEGNLRKLGIKNRVTYL